VQVFNDPEIDRIVALPRRPVPTPEYLDRLSEVLTNALKTPTGTQRLKRIQAWSLAEASQGRLVGLLAPGAGKTLTSALLPRMVKAKRTLVLQPAALRQKTLDDYAALRQHWVFPACLGADESSTVAPGDPIIRVLSYESLSTVNYATYIDEFDPDLIIPDEAHFLAVLKSGRSKRVFRFLKQKRKTGRTVHYMPLTGTGWWNSIRQVVHHMDAALGDASPLPRDWNTVEQVSMCIDQGVKEELRYKPGALSRLCPDKVNPDLDTIRRAVRDRIIESAGVVTSREVSCSLPLILQRRDVVVPADVRTAMAALRTDYVLPTSDSVEPGVTFWNHTREVANGFAYYMDPPPPKEWRDAKAAWYAFVRNRVESHGRVRYDTPLQVWNAAEAGTFGPCPEFDRWKAIRHTFTPVTKPYWISDYLVRDAEEWALQTGGIVWVSHSTAYTDEPDDDSVGGRFTKIPYFGAGDERIKHYRGPCAASVRSHGTGKNLQQWSEALIMGFPSGGKTIEQLLARLHRDGQKADLVKFHFYAHSLENLNAIEKCLGDAKFVEATSGADQRVLFAHWLDADGHAFVVEDYRRRQDQSDPMWGGKAP
jgi:hypothetical protein